MYQRRSVTDRWRRTPLGAKDCRATTCRIRLTKVNSTTRGRPRPPPPTRSSGAIASAQKRPRTFQTSMQKQIHSTLSNCCHNPSLRLVKPLLTDCCWRPSNSSRRRPSVSPPHTSASAATPLANPQNPAVSHTESHPAAGKHPSTIPSARVGRVGMKESILQPEENTQPVRLPFHLHGVTHGRFCLFLRPVVVFRGRNVRIQRYVKIVIKIRPKRRQSIYASKNCALDWRCAASQLDCARNMTLEHGPLIPRA
jgi:hypothetical protein